VGSSTLLRRPLPLLLKMRAKHASAARPAAIAGEAAMAAQGGLWATLYKRNTRTESGMMPK
jgi:hypothetical protein